MLAAIVVDGDDSWVGVICGVSGFYVAGCCEMFSWNLM